MISTASPTKINVRNAFRGGQIVPSEESGRTACVINVAVLKGCCTARTDFSLLNDSTIRINVAVFKVICFAVGMCTVTEIEVTVVIVTVAYKIDIVEVNYSVCCLYLGERTADNRDAVIALGLGIDISKVYTTPFIRLSRFCPVFSIFPLAFSFMLCYNRR